MTAQILTPKQIDVATSRRAAFIAAIPKPLSDTEDKLPRFITDLNASTQSKLHRIYVVTDEIMKFREPFVACAKGCSACCHMNISITSAEAERLGKAIGRRPIPIRNSLHRSKKHFAGKPCTFLVHGGTECSVYAERPLACRTHASFFTDAAPCQPDVMNDIEVPQVAFGGLNQALFATSSNRGNLILADIRDFFPPSK